LAQSAGKTDAVASEAGTQGALRADMLTLLRRLIIGWLLTRLLRRVLGRREPARRP
jgi:hypothetical protein